MEKGDYHQKLKETYPSIVAIVYTKYLYHIDGFFVNEKIVKIKEEVYS
jgi:hypothetical protein